MRFAIFWLHLSKLLHLPRKVIPGHTKCCTCHAKSPQQTWRSDAPKCNPSQHLWWTCLLYCAWHATCIFAGPLQMSHACHRFWKCHKPSRFAHFWPDAPSRAPATRNDIWTSKSALFRHLNFQSGPKLVCFLHLTSKCASRHNGVHFFDIWASKSGPELVCFLHFDFDMSCFAPQRRAIFHLSSGQLAPHPPL